MRCPFYFSRVNRLLKLKRMKWWGPKGLPTVGAWSVSGVSKIDDDVMLMFDLHNISTWRVKIE